VTATLPTGPRTAPAPLRPSWEEPARLAALRAAGAEAARDLGWPSSSEGEDWRRTPQIDRLDPGRFLQPDPLGRGGAASLPAYLAEALAEAGAASGAEAVGVDDARGHLRAAAWAGDGAEPFATALARDPGALARLGSVLAPGHRPTVAHNTARFAAGTLVEVRRGDRARTVHLVHGVEPGQVAWPRTLVVLEAGTECTLVEEWRSAEGEGSALLAPVTELVVGQGARLRHVLLHRAGPEVVALASSRAVVDRDGAYEAAWVLIGGSWSKVYLEVALRGPGSSARLRGCAVARGSQHVDLQTTQAHEAPAAESDLLHRTVVQGRARSIYAGLIRVAKGAQKTNAYVQNRNLLLSPTAKADSNPTLEILANDVRCTHGATAGPVDPDQLFYCRSRGIEGEAARDLIVGGFLADVLDELPLAPLRPAATAWVAAALTQPGEPNGG